MIALVDQHVVDRFLAIKVNGTSIPVAEPGPDRDEGHTKHPSVAVSHYLPVDLDDEMARPNVELFIPSEEQASIDVPEWQGGGVITGPASYTRKPYPTPIVIYYQIDLLATKEADANMLAALHFEALPPGYAAKINGRTCWFKRAGKPANLDNLGKPKYRTAHRYEVTGAILDRLTAIQTPSLLSPRLTLGTMDGGTDGQEE